MTHPRTSIRVFIAALLRAAATAAGDRVYPSRDIGLERSALPAIVVFDDGEEVQDPESHWPRRDLAMMVEVHLVDDTPDEADAALDSIAWDIEAALDGNPRLGGLAIGTEYRGMKKDRDAKGQDTVATMVMEFGVEYTLRLPGPEMEAFELYHGEYANYPGTVDEVHLEQPPEEE